jgi:glycosyltransferase involved in cell wall biosynthesis
MNILRIISSINPAHGGVAATVKESSCELERQGHRVTVLTLDSPSDPWVNKYPVELVALGPGTLGGYRFTLKLNRWLDVHASAFDVTLIEGLWQYGSLGASWTLRRRKMPYVVVPHGMLDPWFKHQFPYKHLKKLVYWLLAEYWVIKGARLTLFTAKDELLSARNSFALYQANERIASLGIRVPEVDLEKAKIKFLASKPKLRNKRLILFLGRVHPKKGLELLLQAWAESLSASSDFHLVIAGPCDNTYQCQLKQRIRTLGIEESVSWLGMVNGMEKWGVLGAAELFVLSSYQENFGIAVVEALASGTPVLISNRVNIWREIEASRAGLVCNTNANDVAKALRRWLALSSSERAAMGTNAVECFENEFRLDKAVAILVAQLSGLMQEAHVPEPTELRL